MTQLFLGGVIIEDPISDNAGVNPSRSRPDEEIVTPSIELA